VGRTLEYWKRRLSAGALCKLKWKTQIGNRVQENIGMRVTKAEKVKGETRALF